ncbi:uroporphyrinogen-III C-methyltransferase [Paenibacillus lemnae]|uniref:Uroporphyrinogen-III C-methyltransferase n=1 Tax=Paenibacillus lemnae TaxID=1330551 RepID=A0A848M6K9_PAELE|nr:uroporphyrinogen-III C-methyltransferase [Paenibacillus lemnae]NMO95841.1 uroporphyrinogen-III C-methyltransferase [Paenibacillus lemnae]
MKEGLRTLPHNRPGTVHIVGAGPGDPELITLKALRCIQGADVIMYDRLVNEQLLQHAKKGAQLHYCGKAPGLHSVPQEQIQKQMAEYALSGLDVVRLKGGDPFIFGRGGEEAGEMAAKGIPYEIIPGVTAAAGAASSSGIPLTHRGCSTSVALVSGTCCSENSTGVRWDLLAQSVDTLVIYMGVSNMPEISRALVNGGRPKSTPAAIVEQGTCPEERVITGTLGNIHQIASALHVQNPALIIVGDVVLVREQLLQLAAAAQERTG